MEKARKLEDSRLETVPEVGDLAGGEVVGGDFVGEDAGEDTGYCATMGHTNIAASSTRIVVPG